MASTTVRWVLVEGTTGEGVPVDRGACDGHDADVDGLLAALLDANDAAVDRWVHAVGVSWTTAAADTAGDVLLALAARGIDDVVAISDIEAAESLATGIAEITGYDDLAVCVAEPDTLVTARCGPDGTTVERMDQVDADGLVSALDLGNRQPEAIFVVGSGDHDPVFSALAAVTAAPVISAAEADFALARGAALASARAVNSLQDDAVARPQRMARTGALMSVLTAAVVTFVVSLSVAVGLQLTPNAGPQQPPQMSNTADQRTRLADPHSAAPLAPTVTPSVPPMAAPLVVAETIAVAAPPVPEAAPEPASAPPVPPVNVPPAPPAYVPPAQVPQPRLRDRIIERIPILNRFHEPQYPQ